MKKHISLALCALALAACTSKETKSEHAFIKPLSMSTELSEYVKNAEVPATFSTSDFNWMGGNLEMTVYSEDLYDTVELHQMNVGDTLLFNGDTIIVNKIEGESDLTINGGIEEGGAYLVPNEGGTYRALLMDDHSAYTKLGKVQLPLSEQFTIIDCGDNPTDPYDTIRTDQKLYLENVKEYKREFNELNTRVQVEDGIITCITRHWIP